MRIVRFNAKAGTGGVEEGRFVDVTDATGVADYATAAAAAEAVTLNKADEGEAVTIQWLTDNSSTFWVEVDGVVAKGGEVEVGTDGKATALSGGVSVARVAKATTTDGEMVEGYRKS